MKLARMALLASVMSLLFVPVAGRAADHIKPTLNLKDQATDKESICVDDKKGGRLVNKAALAAALIDAWHLTRIQGLIEERLSIDQSALPPNATRATAWRTLFTEPDVCDNPANACSDGEKAHLNQALGFINESLLGNAGAGAGSTKTYTGISPTATGATPRDYFLGPDTDKALTCAAPTAADNPPDPTTFTFAWTNFRVRGVPDQLVSEHGAGAGPSETRGATSLFNSSDGASISYKYNGAQKSRADNYVGTIGYAFNFRMGDVLQTNWPILEVVPYFGIDREASTKPTGTPPLPVQSFTANLIHLGVLGDGFYSPGSSTDFIGQWFMVRPDYLINYLDQSRVASLNLRYVPVVSWPSLGINSMTSYFDGQVMAAITLDARLNGGLFVVKGTPVDPTLNQSFLRLGGRGGAVAQFNFLEGSPIDAYVNYTDFIAANGYRKDLGELQASLTFNFTKDKIFGLTVNYRNGRREDNGQRDQAWTVGLTSKY